MFEVLNGTFAYIPRSFGDNQQKQTLISLVRRYYEDGLDNFIDSDIRDQVNIRSFHIFKEIAYQCISWNLEDRPTMKTIIKRIQEALDIQNPEASSTINTAPSHQHQSLESSAHHRKSIGDDRPKTLVNLVRHHYDDQRLDVLIDPLIHDQVHSQSFRLFIRIVYRCISLNLEDRPTIKRIVKRIEEAQDIQNHYEAASTIATQSIQHQNLESFRISLKEINLAIKDFSQETPIGDGGYELAWRCISLTLRERPTMETIIEGIDAIEFQVSTFP
ncbi:unnamed protein product [Lactuca virosa]|uniref:Serine-threonine/tyrosine-protein kinase catalytic domain-containing protein n=1 Tax=Lactuca virosa TaxID=75947 RepID=A0AAU9NTV2_9ASTR|nr:unnamed protein product [Lactuca virosa]